MKYYNSNNSSCGCNQGRGTNSFKFIQETNCYYPEEWNDEKDYDNDQGYDGNYDRCDWPRRESRKEYENWDTGKEDAYDNIGKKKCHCREEKCEHEKEENRKPCENRNCNRCCLCNLFRNCRRW